MVSLLLLYLSCLISLLEVFGTQLEIKTKKEKGGKPWPMSHGFILHVNYYFLASFFFFFLEKFLVVCFYKDGDFVFGLAYSFHFFFLFDEIIFISFRCSFSKWVHLAYGLLLLLFFFFFGESFADLFWSVTFLLVSNSINNSYYWNAYL